jgi:hypothetical protein
MAIHCCPGQADQLLGVIVHFQREGLTLGGPPINAEISLAEPP